MPIRSIVYIFLLLFSASIYGQTITSAGLMTVRDPYSSAYAQTSLYRPLPNGNTVITGSMGAHFVYGGYDSRNDSVCTGDFACDFFVALINKQNRLIWIKYTNGAFTDVAFDSKSNIILAGNYRSILHTSNGDVVPLLSNNTNYYGNVFVMKLDSLGNTLWIRTTDNEAYVQFYPFGTYLKTDPDDNIYLAGHFEYFIRFDSAYAFYNISPGGAMPFLAKLDSAGMYKWVRDWGEESGLESGLELDSCRINMFVGTSPTHKSLRKYDFAGKWVDHKIFPSTASDYASRSTLIKNDLVAMPGSNGDLNILIYHINGNLLKQIRGIDLSNGYMAFTRDNNIFFSSECVLDTCSIGTTKVLKGFGFGVMDTSGQVKWYKNVPRTYYVMDVSLSPKGRLYFVSSLTNYINPYDFYTIDTITFNNLTYLDTLSLTDGGINYRLFARYDLSDSLYTDTRTCQFSPAVDSCLDRQGLNKCNIITSVTSPEQDRSVFLTPNPTSGFVKISIRDPFISTKFVAQIYNAGGILKKQLRIKSGDNIISLHEFQNGFYFVRLIPDDSRKAHIIKKLIIVNH